MSIPTLASSPKVPVSGAVANQPTMNGRAVPNTSVINTLWQGPRTNTDVFQLNLHMVSYHEVLSGITQTAYGGFEHTLLIHPPYTPHIALVHSS
jgi:hypothetical protein